MIVHLLPVQTHSQTALVQRGVVELGHSCLGLRWVRVGHKPDINKQCRTGRNMWMREKQHTAEVKYSRV